MKISIDLGEELVQPLVTEHLETGISVKQQIGNAVSLYLNCKEEVRLGKQVVSGTGKNGYFSIDKSLMGKQKEA